jgi:hypothetical protein
MKFAHSFSSRRRPGSMDTELLPSSTQIVPVRIISFDGIDFPITTPIFNSLFTRDSIRNADEGFVVDKSIDFIFSGKAGANTKTMLTHAPFEVVCDTDVKRAVFSARKNINKVGHSRHLMCSWIPACAGMTDLDATVFNSKLATSELAMSTPLMSSRRRPGSMNTDARSTISKYSLTSAQPIPLVSESKNHG